MRILTLLLLLVTATASAMPGYKEIKPTEIEGNYTKMLSEDWAALSAGDKNSFNTMTVSWGAIGHLWQKPVVMVFIRPNRHTHSFIKKHKRATLSYFGGANKDDLRYIGSHSGKNENKIAKTKLKTIFTPSGLPTFSDAQLIVEGKMLYKTQLEEDKFIEKEFMLKNKSQSEPFHEIIIFEIEKVWKKEN